METDADGAERRIVAGSDPGAMREAFSGCDAAIIVHHSVTAKASAGDDGVSDPTLPLLEAVGQGGVRRLIVVSSRDIAEAPQASGAKRTTEAVIRRFPGEWLHLRASTVYGITNDPLTLFLIMMRSLPAVPIVSGAHLQPLWRQDLAQAAAAALSLAPADVDRVLELAGPETITQEQLYERVAASIDRRPLRIPVPDFVAAHGGRLAEALRVIAPSEVSRYLGFATDKVEELAATDNALTRVFSVTPTSVGEGLQRLVAELDEVTPSEGVGGLDVKQFSARIVGSQYDAAGLLQLFRSRFKDMMPIEVGLEPIAPSAELTGGAVVTMALPGRGHVQVRVEEVAERHVVVATLRGHAVAGIVRFSTRPDGDATIFEVLTCDRAANALDWLTLTLGGARVQDANWVRVVQNVVKLSGGTADDVSIDHRKLAGEEADDVDRWIRAIIQRQRAAGAGSATGSA
jgi:NADH dehydrogenase